MMFQDCFDKVCPKILSTKSLNHVVVSQICNSFDKYPYRVLFTICLLLSVCLLQVGKVTSNNSTCL